jgi:hypothetical protein
MQQPDASHHVADASHAPDSAVAGAAAATVDAAARTDGAVAGAVAKPVGAVSGSAGRDAAKGGEAGRAAIGGGGVGGSAGRGGGMSIGAGSGGTGADGAQVDDMLGDTGLRVSDILGFYSGDWGDMVLRKQADEIRGVYEHDGGTIVGAIMDDGVFVGWWSQLPSRTGTDAGEVEFRWSGTTGTAIALDGRWRWQTGGEWFENWDIGLVTDRAAPSDLTARFDSPSDFKRHP